MSKSNRPHLKTQSSHTPVNQPAIRQAARKPVAAPVYRPQAQPKALQRKTVTTQAQVKPALRPQPVAPPPYRPQPMPKVLQAKKATDQLRVDQTKRVSVAPPVYRPQPTPKVLQRKADEGRQPQSAQSGHQPVAPPVYRPQPVPKVLQRKTAAAQVQPGLTRPAPHADSLRARQQLMSQPASQASAGPKPQISRTALTHGAAQPNDSRAQTIQRTAAPNSPSAQRGSVIQRTMVGPLNNMDTTVDSQEQQIKDWLKSLAQGPMSMSGWSILQDVYNQIVTDNHYRADVYASYIRGLFSDLAVVSLEDYLQQSGTGENVTNLTLYLDGILHSRKLKPYVSHSGVSHSVYATVGQHHHQEIGMSQQDSEVYMLEELDQYLFSNLASVKGTIEIEVVSKNGACDGCKERMRYFARKVSLQWKALGKEERLELRISYTYLRDPKPLTGARTGSHYGYMTDRFDMDVLPDSGKMIYTGAKETVVTGLVEMKDQDDIPVFMEQS